MASILQPVTFFLQLTITLLCRGLTGGLPNLLPLEIFDLLSKAFTLVLQLAFLLSELCIRLLDALLEHLLLFLQRIVDTCGDGFACQLMNIFGCLIEVSPFVSTAACLLFVLLL